MAIFELLAHIVDDEPPRLPDGAAFTPAFADFVRLCLIKDPERRPKLDALIAHPWIVHAVTEPADMRAWATDSLPPAA